MSETISAAADLLFAARADAAHPLSDLPAGLKPADAAAAYAIQAKTIAKTGPIGGWKVAPLAADGSSQCSPLPAATLLASGGNVPVSRLRGIEAEIAVRISRDLPPRATPYSREEVIAAIDAMLPVIELLESAYAEPNQIDKITNLADRQTNGALVLGTPIAAWQGIDLAAETMEQLVDGALNHGRTGFPGGDLIAEVVWLANVGSQWAGGLKAGQIVTCGSWSGSNRVGPNAQVEVKFSSFAPVTIRYGA